MDISLAAVLLFRLRRAGVTVRLDKDGSPRVGPPEKVTPEIRAMIALHRNEIMEALKRESTKGCRQSARKAIEKLALTDAPWTFSTVKENDTVYLTIARRGELVHTISIPAAEYDPDRLADAFLRADGTGGAA